MTQFSIKNIEKCPLIICDHSVEEWKTEVLPYLQNVFNNFSTDAMSDFSLVLQGQKAMLSAMIKFIENN
jgi:hypothetical protein